MNLGSALIKCRYLRKDNVDHNAMRHAGCLPPDYTSIFQFQATFRRQKGPKPLGKSDFHDVVLLPTTLVRFESLRG